MNITLSQMLEHIHRLEIVDVRDAYGMEIDGGYGNPDTVYDNLSGSSFLETNLRFIQLGDAGQIVVILNLT